MSQATKILDGKWLAKQFRRSIAEAVSAKSASFGRPPGLAVILVGENPASKAYVGTKEKVAAKCGFKTFDTRLPFDATFDQVAGAIRQYNQSPEVDGILLQLPLPDHLDSKRLIDLIDPAKDADGLHPYNQGLLIRGSAALRPCTPRGVMALLDLSCLDPSKIGCSGDEPSLDTKDLDEADLSGKRAVVVGRSILVGKPLALMLLERNATVSVIHSRTSDAHVICRDCDIVIAAVGKEHLVGAEWVRPGATVIDVGINRTAEGTLTGDVDFESVAPLSAAITPVPGGVGPMTVAMLMDNTLKAYLGSAQ